MGTVDAPDVYTRVPVDESQSSPEASSEELCGESSAHRRVSLAYIYVLCVASFGINVAWALEFATVTPFFESGLGATDFVSHAVWIVGPLSGLIVAPIVGALSDSCTSRFGRRRPFIVAGMVATVVGMLCFSSAREIAAWAFPPTTSANAHSLASLIIAMSAFCILDLAINTTMWPVRALQGDLLPPIEQHRVQSASVVLGSLGDLAANALIDSFDQPLTHIRFCYFVAALVYTCSVMVLLVIGREEPLDPDAAQTQNAPSNIFSYLRSIPGWLWRIGGTYALGFFTLFCAMPYASSWLGSSVLGGNPKAKKGSAAEATYEKGVKIYGKASLLRALVQIAFAAVYPFLLRFISPGKLMGVCFGTFGIFLAILSSTKSMEYGELIIVLLGFPGAAHFTLPTGLTVEYSDETNRGRHLGALNCFAVVPQLIDTTYTGWVSEKFGESAVMKIGAVWGILTGISGFLFMKVEG
ncbi:Sucrose transport protein SUC2 [Gracilariopsis chorda]|uniref:Sucrose transport protein SUC2 n=1 Tax=Gracilariopsis chorda TaxID=448386 RepID=A0A2V3ILI8_9FLOR|nr:Sucrose transport protein SUC2 [Gracilariopsis chorda]|eukprot:PXF42952.1 Sucrose transport protein SUC2 [Gracilariopsis chorda]